MILLAEATRPIYTFPVTVIVTVKRGFIVSVLKVNGNPMQLVIKVLIRFFSN